MTDRKKLAPLIRWVECLICHDVGHFSGQQAHFDLTGHAHFMPCSSQST